MKIQVIGSLLGYISEDKREDVEVAEELNKICDTNIIPFSAIKEDKSVDVVLIIKQIYSIGELEIVKKTYPNAKIAYWMPDFCKVETSGYFQGLVSNIDLYIGRHYYDSWIRENHIPYFYWNFDVALSIYKKEYNPNYPLRNLPEVVPVSFVFNWTHNQFRIDITREIQKAFPGQVHIVSFFSNELEASGLENVNGHLFGSEFNYVVHRSKINLSIENSVDPGWWSPRTARIMCAGGFPLVYYIYGMETVFKDYVVYFYSAEDAIGKIKYYLEHEEERKRIAERGYKWANRWLRPKYRVNKLYNRLLKLKSPATF